MTNKQIDPKPGDPLTSKEKFWIFMIPTGLIGLTLLATHPLWALIFFLVCITIAPMVPALLLTLVCLFMLIMRVDPGPTDTEKWADIRADRLRQAKQEAVYRD